MRNCYISRNYRNLATAGGKAKTDIEAIMTKNGFVNLGLKQTCHKNEVLNFILTLTGVILAMFRLRKGDVLLLQYPMKKYYEAVCNVAHWKGAKVVTQIHDLNSFRSKRLTPKREMERLNHSDAVIAHNETMRNWLKDQGCKAVLEVLGIFDYLSPQPVVSKRPSPAGTPFSFFFLGNLNPKSNPFVYELAKRLKSSPFFLYGNNYHAELLDGAPTAEYEGYAKDFDLMDMNKGDFGLSWYGESLDKGIGKIGEYMAYNNPHKVSLYIRCHVPIILSKNAGLAGFIESNEIGICVDNLNDLEETLEKVTVDDYMKMRDKVMAVSEKIASGFYFETAFSKATKKICG